MRAGLSGWPRVILVASLALNLFVVGTVSTAWIAGRGWLPFFRVPERHGRLVGMPNPRQLRAALADRQHQALDQALQAHGPEIRQRIRDLVAARVEVANAMRGEPFDRAGLEAALARLREREAAVALATQTMMVDLVGGLDAEGRSRVADLLPPRRSRPARDR